MNERHKKKTCQQPKPHTLTVRVKKKKKEQKEHFPEYCFQSKISAETQCEWMLHVNRFKLNEFSKMYYECSSSRSNYNNNKRKKNYEH